VIYVFHYRLVIEEEDPNFKTPKWSWNEQKYGYGFQRGPKPRMTVLAKASSKLGVCSF
jgi:hypothetical protein